MLRIPHSTGAKTLRVNMLALVALSWPLLAAEPEAPRPWLKRVAPPDRLAKIHTLRAEANVEVSDGTSFSTTVVYHDPQHAVFRSQDAERTMTMGIEPSVASDRARR